MVQVKIMSMYRVKPACLEKLTNTSTLRKTHHPVSIKVLVCDYVFKADVKEVKTTIICQPEVII